MDLYSSILKLAPLILIKIFADGALRASGDGPGRGRFAVAADIALVGAGVVGGFVAALVLGDVIDATSTTRWIVVVSGCVVLLVLAATVLRDVAALHRRHVAATSLTTPSDTASASPGQVT